MASEKDASVSSLPPGEPVPSKSTAASLLLSAPSQIDSLLSHLHRCVQTRAGTDVFLLWLTYATRLTANIIEHLTLPPAASHKLLRVLLDLPKAIVQPGSKVAAIALSFATRLRALSTCLAEVRTFNRLWGLLGLYFAAKGAIAKARAAKSDGCTESPQASFDRTVGFVQLAALISYQAAENIAYLSSKKILPFSVPTQGRLAKLSVRSWAVYVGLELGKAVIDRATRTPLKAYDAESVKEEKQWRQHWATEFGRSLAWAPLTINWSVSQPFLPDLGIALLAFYPSMGMMKDLWRQTA